MSSGRLYPQPDAGLVRRAWGSLHAKSPIKQHARPTASSKRQSLELGLDEGWGVQVVPQAPLLPSTANKQAEQFMRNKPDVAKAGPGKANGSRPRAPYVDLRSPQGISRMAALKQQLGEDGAVRPKDVNHVRPEGQQRRRLRDRMLAGLAQLHRDPRKPAAMNGEGHGDDTQAQGAAEPPAFQIELGADGMDVKEFDAAGNVKSDLLASGPDALAQLSAGGQDVSADGGDGGAEQVFRLDYDDEEDGAYWQQSLSEQVNATSRRSTTQRRQAHDDDDDDEGVCWGGDSAVNFEEQEAVLSRIFKPHKVRQMMAHQYAAVREEAELKAKEARKRSVDASLRYQLRIIAGSAANKRLMSPMNPATRPMMEKVRQAIFSMLECRAGSMGGLPAGSRWLDLFAGTGSVGLEALSRGAGHCHFVEMDAWLTRNVLGKNIHTCGMTRQCVVHTSKVEDFLTKAIALPSFTGGPFDFISLCPPYLLVSYPQLFDLLHRSSLLHPGSMLFVEYPKQLAHEVPQVLGPLVKVRDRRYGRTWVALYAAGGEEGAGEVMEGDSILAV